MFSATLGLSRGPSRSVTLIQLGLLNVAAILVIMGRLVGEPGVLAAGVSIFVPVIAWVTWQVHTMWSASVNRRFSITGTFYRLAGVSLLFGSSIGGALGIGAFNEPASYLAPRGIHSILNVFGWAGMTIVGTAITIVPTVLHVRSPSLKVMRPVPWLMAGGLLVMATGSDDEPGMAGGIGHGDLPVWACGFRLIPQDRPIDPQTSQSPDGRVVSRRGHGLGRNHRNSPRHRNDARRQRCDARPGRRRWRRRICIPSFCWCGWDSSRRWFSTMQRSTSLAIGRDEARLLVRRDHPRSETYLPELPNFPAFARSILSDHFLRFALQQRACEFLSAADFHRGAFPIRY